MEIEKLQKSLGHMLRKVSETLDNHQIPYFVAGGTLLGTVRNQGFIPWDDDVDIALIRKDYEHFVEIANSILPFPYILEVPDESSNFPYLFAKIYDTSTTLVEGHSQPIKRGIYIDVFPLDKITSNQTIQKRKIRKHRRLQKTYRRLYGGPLKSRKLLGRITHPILSSILKHIYPKKLILKNAESNISESSKSEFVNNYFGSWKEKEIHRTEWYSDFIYLDFMDFKVKVPKGYDQILATLYGDYMQLPEEENRTSHHQIKFIDLNKSYLEN